MLSRNALSRLLGLLVLFSVVVSCAPAPTAQPTEPVAVETPAAGETPAAEATAAPMPDSEMGPLVGTFKVMTKTASAEPDRFEISRMIVEAWDEFGFPAELWPVAVSVITEQAFDSKQFDVYMMGQDPRTSRMEPEWWIRQFDSAEAGDTGLNWSGYQNPEFDALAEAQRAATDPAARKEIVDQAQQMIYDAHTFHVYLNPYLAGAYNKATFADPTLWLGHPVWNFWAIQTLRPIADQKIIRVGGVAMDIEITNPLLAAGGDETFLLGLVYDSLCEIGVDGAPQPWAAESIVGVSPTEYEVTLREGMTWHDGEPVTAEDVAFTFNYAKEVGAPFYATDLGRVKAAEVIGPNKVRITLNQPYAAFEAAVLCELPMLPQHIWETIENPLEFTNPDAIGSGPFKHEYLVSLEEWMLSRNDDHFQPPLAEGLVRITYGSQDAMLGAMEQGEIDVYSLILNPADVERLRGLPHVQIEEVQSFGVRGIVYNTRFEPFNDRYFRHALSLVVPIEDIIDIVMLGAGEPGGSVIAPALSYWHNDDIPPWPHDPEEAKRLLLEAGYTWDSEGRLHYPTPENDNRLIDTGPQLYE
jgi:peptide/nickel transport system substrate-binding protein